MSPALLRFLWAMSFAALVVYGTGPQAPSAGTRLAAGPLSFRLP